MLDFSKVGQRIREARESLGISLRKLAERTGYSYGTIQGWEKGRRHIGLDDLIRLGKVLGRDPAYFLSDEKPKIDANAALLQRSLSDVLGVAYIPVVGTVKAGEPILAVENIEEQIPVPKSLVANGDTVFALRVRGDSMIRAGISEGDLAIIRRQDYIDYPGQIAVVLIGDEGTLKRVCRAKDGSWWLVSENPAYKPMRIASFEDARIVGVYIGLYKQARAEKPIEDYVPPEDFETR